MGEYSHISHTFLPVYDESSELLILGSFPSVKSREQGFYYGHPQNRFWKVLAALCDCEVPQTIEEKKSMLLTNHQPGECGFFFGKAGGVLGKGAMGISCGK